MFVFGPVPSRRLGQSIGINSIPGYKKCTYDCVYCQVGPTPAQTLRRRTFYQPEEIANQVEQKLAECRDVGAPVDYVTFVPDGEPTLDVNLGRAIELLKPMGCKLAIITNGTLIDHEDVREELLSLDWVSLKVDSVDEEGWRAIDRPQKSLQLQSILDGIHAFAQEFTGTLATETMLVNGMNDDDESLSAVAEFLADLQPSIAYVAAPTRPPAESWVRVPDESALHRAYQIFDSKLDKVEYLLGFPEDPFRAVTDPAEGILAITAVHPMREHEAVHYVRQMGAEKDVLDTLVAEQKLTLIEYDGLRFYVRRLRGEG